MLIYFNKNGFNKKVLDDSLSELMFNSKKDLEETKEDLKIHFSSQLEISISVFLIFNLSLPFSSNLKFLSFLFFKDVGYLLFCRIVIPGPICTRQKDWDKLIQSWCCTVDRCCQRLSSYIMNWRSVFTGRARIRKNHSTTRLGRESPKTHTSVSSSYVLVYMMIFHSLMMGIKAR